jgi:hypothetical protein
MENKAQLIIGGVLFSLAATLIIIGFFRGDERNENNKDNLAVSEEKNITLEGEDLSQYFEKSGTSGGKSDEYSKNDPFIDTCSQTQVADNIPVVNSNIVCLR